MLIQVDDRTIPYEQFTFPDGQPHIELAEELWNEHVDIQVSLTSANVLFDLLLVKDILDDGGNDAYLEITYLLGARMDRRIDNRQPFTLKVVLDILGAASFAGITVLDPHSSAAVDLLPLIEPQYPYEDVEQLLAKFDPSDTVLVAPDKGSTKRVNLLGRENCCLEREDSENGDQCRCAFSNAPFTVVQCRKERDSQTGRLSGFTIENPDDVKANCIIIDDICDGGGTFVGLAKELRAAGATKVVLFVTHGIFSQGRDLPGIDEVHTTDSYRP